LKSIFNVVTGSSSSRWVFLPERLRAVKANILAQKNKDKGHTKSKATIIFEMMFNVRYLDWIWSIYTGWLIFQAAK
jgi:hypothetical protein